MFYSPHGCICMLGFRYLWHGLVCGTYGNKQDEKPCLICPESPAPSHSKINSLSHWINLQFRGWRYKWGFSKCFLSLSCVSFKACLTFTGRRYRTMSESSWKEKMSVFLTGLIVKFHVSDIVRCLMKENVCSVRKLFSMSPQGREMDSSHL